MRSRTGFALLPAALVILASILTVGFAVSTRTASATRQLEAARARRLLTLAARCVAMEAAAALEKAFEPVLSGATPADAAARVAANSAARTIEPALSRQELADQRVKIGAVTAEVSALKDGRWGVAQFGFDVEAPGAGAGLKRRVTVRRYVTLRRGRSGVRLHVASRDVARAQEVVR